MNYCVHIFVYQKKVLLLKRSRKNPFFPLIWTPIIGKIRKEEPPEKAVLRETIEETSLNTMDEISFFTMDQYNNDNYWFYYTLWEECHPIIELNHENEHYDFFCINNLPGNLWRFFEDKIRILSNHFTN